MRMQSFWQRAKRFSRVIHNRWQQFWKNIDGDPGRSPLSNQDLMDQLNLVATKGQVGWEAQVVLPLRQQIALNRPGCWHRLVTWGSARAVFEQILAKSHAHASCYDVHCTTEIVLFHGDEPDWFHGISLPNCSQHQKRLPNGRVLTNSSCKLDRGSSRYHDQFLVRETNRKNFDRSFENCWPIQDTTTKLPLASKCFLVASHWHGQRSSFDFVIFVTIS